MFRAGVPRLADSKSCCEDVTVPISHSHSLRYCRLLCLRLCLQQEELLLWASLCVQGCTVDVWCPLTVLRVGLQHMKRLLLDTDCTVGGTSDGFVSSMSLTLQQIHCWVDDHAELAKAPEYSRRPDVLREAHWLLLSTLTSSPPPGSEDSAKDAWLRVTLCRWYGTVRCV